MTREHEPWGGDVRMPSWLRRVLHRPDPAADTAERAHERHTGEEPRMTSGEAADRAGFGPTTELYHEGRRERQARRAQRRAPD